MRLFFITILSLATLWGTAQTKIKLYAPAYKGKYALLNTTEDFVTYKTKKLDKQQIDSLGYATFQIETEEAKKTSIEIGNTSAILYIDPSTPKYSVYFPAAEFNAQKITGQTVSLLYDNLPKDDLNGLILELNYRIDDFLFGDSLRMQRLILQDDSYKDSINELKKVLIKDYRPIKNKYFHEYIKYSVAGIEQLYLSRGMMKNKIYLFEVYLNQYPILYHNDAYMEFFKQNFDGFFQSNLGLYDKIKHAINNYSSAQKLDEALVNSPFLKNDSIRELVTLLNLYESYYQKSFDPVNIISILGQIRKTSTINEHQQLIDNMLDQINLLSPNSEAPNFDLITIKQDTISLSDFKGKYVYLQFFASWNQTAIQELKIMKDLHEKYGKYVEFISISLDESEKEFAAYMKNNRAYKWHIAHYKGENSIIKNYEVLSVPSYVLIDENGKIQEAQALSPAPNYPRPSIDKTFFYIKKAKEPKNTRNVGGKSN
ncbi:MAG: TlpA family protein disulfide reductase [Flavobacteriales bacterium]|jgi:peroxiredoxin|nr:TlpA family protein disulfide reductase [Flavobacteriales bacterium]